MVTGSLIGHSSEEEEENLMSVSLGCWVNVHVWHARINPASVHTPVPSTSRTVQMAIKCKCIASREKGLMRGMRATCLALSTNMSEICQEKEGIHRSSILLWSAMLEWEKRSFWNYPALGLLPHQQDDPLLLSGSLFFPLSKGKEISHEFN